MTQAPPKDANEVRMRGGKLEPVGDPIDLDEWLGPDPDAAPADEAPMPDPDEESNVVRIRKSKLPRGALGVDDPDWEHLLKRTKYGVRKSVGNLTIILQHDVRIRGVFGFNERLAEVQILEEPPYHGLAELPDATYPRSVQDSDDVWLARWLENQYGIDFPTTKIHDAINAVSKRRSFDPVVQYLEGLEWDGKARVDEWAMRYLGAEDTVLNRAFGARWLISLVARAMEPGCQADHVLVLEGIQGVGKSSALRALVGRAEWFADSLPDVRRNKDAAEVLQGPWLIEIGELEGISKAGASTIKAFLTARADRYRPPYGRHVITRPRRCVFAGSTNLTAYLKDATGGRRFWPLPCEKAGPVDPKGIAAARDQLLAEAVVRYRAGEPWYLVEQELIADAKAVQEDRFEVDEWERLIGEKLHHLSTTRREPYVTLGACLQHVGLISGQWGKRDQMRMADILKRLAWQRRRRRTKDGAVWRYEPIPTPDARSGSRSGSSVDRGGVGITPDGNDPNPDPNLSLADGGWDHPFPNQKTGHDPNDPNDPNLIKRGLEKGVEGPRSGPPAYNSRTLSNQLGSSGSLGSADVEGAATPVPEHLTVDSEEFSDEDEIW